jgi:hypothetical protein
MNYKHYKEKLPAFVDQEMDKDERQIIAEHLLVCEDCRREHDVLKLGAALASKLPAADAPDAVWANIQDRLDGREAPNMGLIPQAKSFDWRKGFAFAVSLAVVSTIAIAVYINLFTEGRAPVAHGKQDPAPDSPVAVQPPANSGSANAVNVANTQSEVNSNTTPQNSNSAIETAPLPSWQVETLAGMPIVGDGGSAGQIAVGQMLETDARSRAKIAVANIGSVEIAPNSRVRLVGTGKDEHRLALERGRLHAKIFAPPRLFIVDTPSGKAVDLGCEYTLQVDRAGNSILHVTGGFVALEDGGRESIVPSGMMCMTRKGKGLGTPFSAEADADFRRALEQFDFANGGLQAVLEKADFYDMVTLWHLLSRVPKNDRGAVFDRLAKYVTPPAGVTREGILDLDKKMLAVWRTEVENVWFNN